MKKIKRSVPEALLREQIRDMSLEEVALAPEFVRLIENSLNVLLSNNNRKRRVKVHIKYEPADPITAFTDDYGLYINAGNPMFCENPGSEKPIPVKQSCKRIDGGAFHEIGHVLYTCFSELERMAELFKRGELEPVELFKRGELEPDEPSVAYSELAEVMQNDKASVLQGMSAVPLRRFITQLYMSLLNCIEDGRIEQLLLSRNAGFMGFAIGLQELRAYHKEVGNTWDMSQETIPTFTNLCLLYAKYHSVGSYTGGFEAFENAKPIIDEMLETHEAKKFSQLNQKLVLCLWPLIKELIVEMPDEEQNSDENSSQKSENSAESGGSSEDDPGKTLEKKLEEILDQIKQNVPNESSSQADGSETQEKQTLPAEQPQPSGNSLDATIEDIIKQIADEKVREKASEEECKKAMEQAMRGRGFAPYHGTKIISPSPLPGSSLDTNTEAAIKKAAREIQRHLETDMRTGSSKRKFSGKKFHANKVVNQDFRYFEDKATRKDMPKVKVGLVIDESGSMSSDNRYRTARNAAMTLYRIFEYVPNLDIAIYGHSTRHEVEIFNYADFGIKSKDVEGKLQNISARGGNIDIVPITVMAENLLRQDADSRIMFIITDGLPYSYVRGMSPEEELTEAANKYTRKGIEIIVASIGEDEERIADIYRNQRFLNIQSASELPKKVVDVIKRKL